MLFANASLAMSLPQLTCIKKIQGHVVAYFLFSSQEPGYVGFANLPNQVHRKSVKKGFEFTLMVVGKCCAINNLKLTYYCYMA